MESVLPEIVSTESIKPSKSTPSHLRLFKLSLLDQLISTPYAPIILFYPPDDVVSYPAKDVARKLESLKKSLSETLTRFYPLAGTIRADQLSIECDDRGAQFVVAKLGSSLREFLARPDLIPSLQKLLPCEFGFEPSNDFVSNVQASVFCCGGIAIGLCISHKMLDGVALSSFLQSWSATSHGGGGEGEKPIWPFLDTAHSLFPAEDLWLRDTSMAAFGSSFTKGSCVTKRFLFNASAISNLKAKAIGVENPTRVEAVSAFIWKCVVEAKSKEKNGMSLATHVVNLRRRTTPFLPEHSVGNLLWIVPAKISAADDVAEMRELVGLLRESFSRVDDCFVKMLSGDKGKDLMVECLREIGDNKNSDLVHVGFSSWCKFGFYEADFGWGKPVWVSSVGSSGSVFMNLVILVDTRLGDGIEAWVTLDRRDMAVMECNPQLVSLGVHVDPIPF